MISFQTFAFCTLKSHANFEYYVFDSLPSLRSKHSPASVWVCFHSKVNWIKQSKQRYSRLISTNHVIYLCYQTPCSSALCQNEGTCVENDNDDTFKCVCEKGFNGEYCETGEVIKRLIFTTTTKKACKNDFRPFHINIILVLLLSAAKSCKDIYQIHK